MIDAVTRGDLAILDFMQAHLSCGYLVRPCGGSSVISENEKIRARSGAGAGDRRAPVQCDAQTAGRAAAAV